MSKVSLDNKVNQVSAEMINAGLFTSNDIKDYDTLVEIIKWALKEQDRDTRHACAEAIITNTILTEDTDNIVFLSVVKNLKEYFHAVVMNCNGGLE
jgi:Tfp pilus assembly PilM family ATPase